MGSAGVMSLVKIFDFKRVVISSSKTIAAQCYYSVYKKKEFSRWNFTCFVFYHPVQNALVLYKEYALKWSSGVFQQGFKFVELKLIKE